jgi:hypothetical protein
VRVAGVPRLLKSHTSPEVGAAVALQPAGDFQVT